MSLRHSSSCSVCADEEVEGVEAEELNPFSFREFLRWKNQDPDPEQARTEVRAAQLEVHLCPKAASTNTEWVCAHSCDTRVHVHI